MYVHDVECGDTGLIWLRIGTGDGIFECGIECSVSIICEEFLDYLQEEIFLTKLVS